jgi:hypothetical protein
LFDKAHASRHSLWSCPHAALSRQALCPSEVKSEGTRGCIASAIANAEIRWQSPPSVGSRFLFSPTLSPPSLSLPLSLSSVICAETFYTAFVAPPFSLPLPSSRRLFSLPSLLSFSSLFHRTEITEITVVSAVVESSLRPSAGSGERYGC